MCKKLRKNYMGVFMRKKQYEFNNYTVIDAFKVFFYLAITVGVVSLILNVVITIVFGMGEKSSEFINSNTFAIISYILSPTIFILFYFVYNKIHKVRQINALGDGQKISLLPISVAIVLAIISIFLFTPFMNLVDFLFAGGGYTPDSDLPLQELMASDGKYFLLGIFMYAFLPAIAEELIFRGIIQKSLATRFSGFTTIMITTIMFVLMHGSLQQTVYQFIVGIMLSYLSYVGGSILYSFILHFLNNFLVVVFSCFNIVRYLSASETSYYNIFSMIFPFLIFLLGLVLVAILFWVLKYLRNKNFFRFESKKNKKKNKEELSEPKVGFIKVWSNLKYNEKIYMVFSFVLLGVIWLINTIDGFM